MFDRIRTVLSRLRGPWIADAPAGDLGSLDVANGVGQDVDDAPFGECPPLTPAQEARLLRDLGLTASTDPVTGRVRFRDPAPAGDPIGFVPTQPPRGADGTPPPAAPRGPFPDWSQTAAEATFDEHVEQALGIVADDPAGTITPADLAWLAAQDRRAS